MLIVTTDTIVGKKIVEVLGYVNGQVVMSKNIGKDITSGLRSLAGGELVNYTKMQEESRQIAVDRMVKQAEEMGANAIVGLRFGGASIMQGASEMLAYGTAVRIED